MYVSLLGTVGAGAAVCGVVAYVLGRSARRTSARWKRRTWSGALVPLTDGADREARVEAFLDQYEASLCDTLTVFLQVRSAPPGARREALLAERGEIVERRLDQRAALRAELLRVQGRARSGGAS